MRKRSCTHIFLVVVICIIIALTLYFLGFRITYDPQLENSWDAISAFATWTGVILSAIAIYVAVQIPKKIADRQDRIALFEKRFSFYEALNSCINFAKMIENSAVWDYKDAYFVSSCSSFFIDDESTEISDALKRRLISQITTELKQGRFLFDFDSDELIDSLISNLIFVISLNRSHKNFSSYYREFYATATEIETQLLPKIRNILRLSDSL